MNDAVIVQKDTVRRNAKSSFLSPQKNTMNVNPIATTVDLDIQYTAKKNKE